MPDSNGLFSKIFLPVHGDNNILLDQSTSKCRNIEASRGDVNINVDINADAFTTLTSTKACDDYLDMLCVGIWFRGVIKPVHNPVLKRIFIVSYCSLFPCASMAPCCTLCVFSTSQYSNDFALTYVFYDCTYMPRLCPTLFHVCQYVAAF